MSYRNGNPTLPLAAIWHATRLAYANSPRDGMLLEFLYETGCRNQEARLSLVGDLWRANDVVLSMCVREEIAKGGSRRYVPLSTIFRQKMRQYIHLYRSTDGEPDLASPLFPSRAGEGHLTRRGICRIIKSYLTAAGHTGTPHQFRHTAATEWLKVSNARQVQIMLGHKRLDTVQIYTHPSDEDMRQTQERRRSLWPNRQPKTPQNPPLDDEKAYGALPCASGDPPGQ